MNISEGKYYTLNEDESSFFNPPSNIVSFGNDYVYRFLTPEQIEIVKSINVLDPYKLQQQELNIK